MLVSYASKTHKVIKVNPRRGLNDRAQIFETCTVCLEDSAKKCVLL